MQNENIKTKLNSFPRLRRGEVLCGKGKQETAMMFHSTFIAIIWGLIDSGIFYGLIDTLSIQTRPLQTPQLHFPPHFLFHVIFFRIFILFFFRF